MAQPGKTFVKSAFEVVVAGRSLILGLSFADMLLRHVCEGQAATDACRMLHVLALVRDASHIRHCGIARTECYSEWACRPQ